MFNYNIFGPLAQKIVYFLDFRIFSVPMVTPLNDVSGAQQRNFSQYIY